MSKTEIPDVRRRCKILTRAFEAVSARVATLEARAADVERQHEVVQAARAAWKPQLVARNKLVLVSDAGDFAVVPLSLVRALHAGRPLDLDVEEHEGDVVLVDAAGGVVARMPRAAFMALPRVVATQELRRMLELGVGVGVGSVVGKRGPEGPEVPQKGGTGGQIAVPEQVARKLQTLRQALEIRKASRK